jgi:hypothetical protein
MHERTLTEKFTIVGLGIECEDASKRRNGVWQLREVLSFELGRATPCDLHVAG